MSSAAASTTSAAPVATTPAVKPVVRRTFVRQVLHDTFNLKGAKFGLIWIGILFLFGAYAPLIASSYPILLRVDGAWSSPMWNNLSTLDIVLLVFATTLIGLTAFNRRDIGRHFLDALTLASLVLTVALFTSPDQLLWHFWKLIANLGSFPNVAGVSLSRAETIWTVALAIASAAIGVTLLTLAWNALRRTAVVTTLSVFAVLTLVLIFFAPTPAATANFQAYRDFERQGRADFVLRTIIPFSPTDRLRDMPERRLSGPMSASRIGYITLEDGRRLFGRLEYIDARKADRPGDVDRPAQIKINAGGAADVVAPATALKATEFTVPMRMWNWLGTETDGADLLSRMIHASRIALSIGIIATTISITIGVLVGGLMGYYVGKVDLVGMRLIEIFEAIPGLLVLITVMAAYGRSIYLMMVVIGLLGWTGTARFVRAEFLRLRKQDFVQAAIATGVRESAVIYRHVLPNGLTPVLVTATFGVASAILTEAILSFLGLGLIDEPSWGQMLNQARSGGQGFVWWMAIFPGLAIFLTVFAYALIGDAMRDALDPKLRKRE